MKKEVDLFIPCFMDQCYPETAWNVVKLLERLDCIVHYNPAQTCCGQPAYNAGMFDDAKEVAIHHLKTFKEANRFVVTPSASCCGMMHSGYDRLFGQSSYVVDHKNLKTRTYELITFLTDVLHVNKVPGAKLEGKATYHDSCSGLRECRIKEEPRMFLSNVEGLELIEMADTESCCGFGGTFAVKFEGISSAMAEVKVNHALQTGAQYIISTDTSCLLHLQGYIDKQGLPIKCMHIADVLTSGW
jgi:L-lactate dehydrogenase complex protein LldE